MNLPQNIQKSDGAIARSFSQELGLSLSFKTGRKTILQSELHTGGIPLIMKNKSFLATLNNKNQIVVWSIKHKSIIDVYESIHIELINYHKISETEILVAGVNNIGIFDISTGNFEIKISDIGIISHTIISLNQKMLAIYFSNNENYSVKLFHLNHFYLLQTIDCQELDGSDGIFFAQSSDVICLREKQQKIYLYDTKTYNLLYSNYIHDIKFSKFIDYKNNSTIFYDGIDGWLYELDINTNTYKQVLHSSYKTYFSENVILMAQHNTCSTILNTYSTNDFSHLGTAKIGDFYIEKINIDDEYITGYKKQLNRPGCIFIYDLALNEIATINFSISKKLTQYGLDYHNFGFDDALFDLKNERLYKARKEFRQNLIGNWVDSGFFVTISKTVSMKSPIVTFQNAKNSDNHSVNFYELAGFKPDADIQNIKIEYNIHNQIWIIKLAGRGIILYNAKKREIVSTHQFKGYSNLKMSFSNDFKYALDGKTLSWEYNKYLNQIQLFSVDNEKLIGEYDFSSKSFSYIKYFNNIQKSVVLINMTKTEGQLVYELFYHEFDLELRLKKKQKLGRYINKEIRFTKGQILFDEQKNYLFYIVYNTLGSTLYKTDLKTFNTTALHSFDEYKTGDLTLSADSSTLAFLIEDTIFVFNTEDGRLMGRINHTNKGRYFFSPNGSLLLVAAESKIDFYKITPFENMGCMYIEQNGDFYIEVFPDKISPNGWFCTNTPDKIKVFKTKADGSDAELLPIDDEERQAFIKHHNRKDIVLKKLFEPEKYAEFTKLNASAEDLAKQDMAIELSKVEKRKLEPGT